MCLLYFKYRMANLEVFKKTSLIDIGGALRKYVIADFNSDGFPDIAIAVNREDGRHSSGPPFSEWASQAAFIMSNGEGTYRVDKVGPKMYHHNVTLIKYEKNKWEALFASEPSTENPAFAYRFVNGAWVKNTAYPYLQGSTITALPVRENEDFTTRLASVWGTPSVALYSQGLGSWSKISEQNFFARVAFRKIPTE
jgi:hypothetical protein